MIVGRPHRGLVLVAIALTSACARDTAERLSGVPLASLRADDQPPRFSGWSTPINLGSAVNSVGADMFPFVSFTGMKDGLSLYFGSDRSGTFAIWASPRSDVDQPWGMAQATPVDRANQPALSPDGQEMFFNSARPGGQGAMDLWVSRRDGRRDDLGWQEPMNVVGVVNTGAAELGPALFDADGTQVLYFVSNRAGGLGGNDIYASARGPDNSFGPPVLVEELSSPFNDVAPAVRRDGLEIVLTSDRPGLGGEDLWVASRSSTTERWSTPVNLGAPINTSFNDAGAAFSGDGTALYFHSNANRPGAMGPCFGELGPCFYDIYVATRIRLKGSNQAVRIGDDSRGR